MMAKEKPLHHGKCSKQFDVKYIDTDYFAFVHKPCRDKNAKNHGHALPKYLILDNDGRIIFHLKCLDCGFEDALKTHFELWQVPRKRDYSKRIIIESKLFKKLKGTKPWWPSEGK